MPSILEKACCHAVHFYALCQVILRSSCMFLVQLTVIWFFLLEINHTCWSGNAIWGPMSLVDPVKKLLPSLQTFIEGQRSSIEKWRQRYFLLQWVAAVLIIFHTAEDTMEQPELTNQVLETKPWNLTNRQMDKHFWFEQGLHVVLSFSHDWYVLSVTSIYHMYSSLRRKCHFSSSKYWFFLSVPGVNVKVWEKYANFFFGVLIRICWKTKYNIRTITKYNLQRFSDLLK